MMNIITTKQKFISQLMSGKTTARTCEDVDEMIITYSEMQALATGDPIIKERIELGNKISELKMLESAHNSEVYKMQDTLNTIPGEIVNLKNILEKVKIDKETAVRFAKSNFEIKLGDNLYSSASSETARRDADDMITKEAILTENKSRSHNWMDVNKIIGAYNGFEVEIKSGKAHGMIECKLYVKGELSYETDAGLNESSRNSIRIENLVSSEINKRIVNIETLISQKENDLETAKRIAVSEFERADELKEVSERLTELDEYFSQKHENVVADDTEEEQNKTEIQELSDTPEKDKTKQDFPDKNKTNRNMSR